MARGNWIVAMDAGATATKTCLVNRSGERLAETRDKGFNLRQSDVDTFLDVLVRSVRKLFAEAHLIGHLPTVIVAGVAGAGLPEERELLKSTIKGRYSTALVRVHHDAFIAHYGALSGRPGILVTAGTGSIAFGINEEGQETRAGGWGWMFGDEGSGWWIGRRAIQAALADWEGSGPPTRLRQLVDDRYNLEETYEFIPLFYKGVIKREEISPLASDVHRLAVDGDEQAVSILREAGLELGKLAVIGAKKLGIAASELNVALLGSVAVGAADFIRPTLLEVLKTYKNEQSEGDESLPHEFEEVALENLTGGDKPEISDLEERAGRSSGEGAGKLAPKSPGERDHRLSEYPPKDLTLPKHTGPRIVEPEGDALQGAVRWGLDQLDEILFA